MTPPTNPPTTVTVRSTPQAVAAVGDLATTINGPLLTHFEDLRRFGQVLADPENWDGRTAAEFRASVWPSYERSLTDVHAQLDKLRSRLGEIQAEIVGAG
jgi:hypothetical protein